MSLNTTPTGERIHIGLFGRRNVGKSSILNALLGQDASLVSDVKGTTTDPVYKAMELLPLGPVMIIDTAGIDDEGELGELRMKKTLETIDKIDIALLITDSVSGVTDIEKNLIKLFEQKNIYYIIVYNKSDLLDEIEQDDKLYISTLNNNGIDKLKNILSEFKTDNAKKYLIGDLINEGDLVVLITPIDNSAPKGRLILPQQQVIRDILDNNSFALVLQPEQYPKVLENINQKPALVVTDSQVFSEISASTPEDIPLTSFSILMARYKGFLDTAVSGAIEIDSLNDGDKILIAEACSHHKQCEDIGTVKIPKWIREYTKKELHFDFVSGEDFPNEFSKYKLVIHCGGCMMNEKNVQSRIKKVIDQNVKVTNYGTAIAHTKGILKRSLDIFIKQNGVAK